MKKTPLYNQHISLNGRMVDFAGWHMPVQYSGVMQEHLAVRDTIGIFDVSHMGEIVLEGPNVLKTVQYLTCNDLSQLNEGQCQYSAMLTPQGTFIDDIIVYPHSDKKVFICVNAGNTDKDFAWIQEHAGDTVAVRNESDQWCQLAVQGPKAKDLLADLIDVPLEKLRRFYFCNTKLDNTEILLSRTGYTGEDGFEIYAESGQASVLWDTIMDKGNSFGLQACGLAARDTLRLEAAYPLYGHEIDADTNPFEARLHWIVKLGKDDFLGKAALEEIKVAGWKRELVGIMMLDRGIPREGYSLFQNDKQIGQLVSGTYSPSLKQGIGTAFVTRGCCTKGDEIAVDIRGKKRKARVVSLPFYKSS
jgi:aminomethyltransferase